jgi:hypothetical protein
MRLTSLFLKLYRKYIRTLFLYKIESGFYANYNILTAQNKEFTHIVFAFNSNIFMHLGDHMLWEPVCAILQEYVNTQLTQNSIQKTIVFVLPTTVMQPYFADYIQNLQGYNINSQNTIYITRVEMLDLIPKGYPYIAIDTSFMHTNLTEWLANGICQGLGFPKLPCVMPKNFPLVSNHPMPQHTKILLYSPYMKSLPKITAKSMAVLDKFAMELAIQQGYTVYIVGSVQDTLASIQSSLLTTTPISKYSVIDYRHSSALVDFTQWIQNPNLDIIYVGFDAFWMHVCHRNNRPTYICIRPKLTKAITHKVRTCTIPAFPMEKYFDKPAKITFIHI